VTWSPLVPWTAAKLSDRWTDSDGEVLIVLGGSVIQPGDPYETVLGESSYWRALHAVWAWKTGHFRYILLSGKDASAQMRLLLLAYGIPDSVILVENQSISTRENALFAKPILDRLGGRQVLLTSDYHMWRAARAFRAAGNNIIPRPFSDITKRANIRVARWQCFWQLLDEGLRIVYYAYQGWI
jgi:uncharacterized SAM-binding protein YcdF (DUF218 family)